jgi:TPR repeat protein
LVAAPVRADEAQDRLVEQGVAAYDAGNYAEAKVILLPLAEAGIPWAMNTVGLMHDGTGAFPNDPKTECDWYERAANAGFASGMYNLSICYDWGDGRPKDLNEMLHWRNLAAESGSIPAMINLAALDSSEGEEYRRWMNQAAQHGSVYAKVSLWLQGYKHDVPDLKVQDIVCVSVRILILDGDFLDRD